MEQNEVQRIVIDPEDPIYSEDPGATTPGLETTQKRKSRDVQYSQVWEHFIKGPKQADGSYNATCKYCSAKYLQGNSRSTGSLLHHIRKGCKIMKRHKPDAL
jgi:BED zinc finger